MLLLWLLLLLLLLWLLQSYQNSIIPNFSSQKRISMSINHSDYSYKNSVQHHLNYTNQIYSSAKYANNSQTKLGQLSVICFIVVTIDDTTLNRALQLSQYASLIEVYIIIDSINFNSHNITRRKNKKVHLISYSATYCFEKHYRLSDYMHQSIGSVLGWDKALFLLAHVTRRAYQFAWIIENDVYIPSLQSFWNIHNRSVASRYDLVLPPSGMFTFIETATSNIKNNYGSPDRKRAHQYECHFPYTVYDKSKDQHPHPLKDMKAPNYSPNLDNSGPWIKSMACATGFSSRMLKLIDDYVAKYKRLRFVECFFGTLAFHHNYSIWRPSEMHMITWSGSGQITCQHIHDRSDKWFHPVKDIPALHKSCSSTKYPIKELYYRAP